MTGTINLVRPAQSGAEEEALVGRGRVSGSLPGWTLDVCCRHAFLFGEIKFFDVHVCSMFVEKRKVNEINVGLL